MTGLVAWALVVVGAVYFTTESVIFAPIRIELSKAATARGARLLEVLLYCPACSAFWIGLLAAPLFPIEAPLVLRVVCSGLGAMGLGASWDKALGPSRAWEVEAPLRGEAREHDEATQSETREGAGDE